MEEACFFFLYLQAFFPLTNQAMIIGEGRNLDYPVNNQLYFHPHLSLFSPQQSGITSIADAAPVCLTVFRFIPWNLARSRTRFQDA